MKKHLKQVAKDYRDTPSDEFWIEGVLYNFIYGLLGATIVVAINLQIDIAVLISYLLYYFFVGKVINRPKYVTALGKFIVFPVPTAIGAFIGYKISLYLIG